MTWLDTPTVSGTTAQFTIEPASIVLKEPDTAVDWGIGQMHAIRFTHNLGPDQQVSVELSRNGGATWTGLGSVTTLDDDGTLAWTVSGPATDHAKVRVSWNGGAAADVSAQEFQIRP